MPPSSPQSLLGLTTQIVAAHVGHTKVPASELPALIERVHAALANAGRAPAPAEKPAPSVAPRKSVFPDYIICLEDGRKLKTLKRHLRTTYDMSPEQYREKWHLPADYPMTAPNYAERRSTLAKALGLGRREAAAPAASPAPVVAEIEPEAPTLDLPEPEVEALRDGPEPDLATVFARFPKAAPEAEAAPEPAPAAAATPARKRQPFSKQRTRTMRPV